MPEVERLFGSLGHDGFTMGVLAGWVNGKIGWYKNSRRKNCRCLNPPSHDEIFAIQFCLSAKFSSGGAKAGQCHPFPAHRPTPQTIACVKSGVSCFFAGSSWPCRSSHKSSQVLGLIDIVFPAQFSTSWTIRYGAKDVHTPALRLGQVSGWAVSYNATDYFSWAYDGAVEKSSWDFLAWTASVPPPRLICGREW